MALEAKSRKGVPLTPQLASGRLDAMIDRISKLGVEVYKADWYGKQVNDQSALWVSEGRVKHVTDLTKSEAEKLLRALEKKAGEVEF